MIPFIQEEAAEKHKWVTDKEILDIIAVSESTPGPIAINSATFVGYKACGFWGAVCATVGVALPAFAVIMVISLFLRQFSEFKPVKYAFFGVRAGVIALIIKAVFSMSRQCEKTVFALLIALAAFIAVGVWSVSVPLIIICSAAAGLVYCFITVKGGGEHK